MLKLRLCIGLKEDKGIKKWRQDDPHHAYAWLPPEGGLIHYVIEGVYCTDPQENPLCEDKLRELNLYSFFSSSS